MSDSYFMVASIVLFTAGILTSKNTGIRLTRTVFILSVTILFFLLFAGYVVSDYFTGEGFNEAVLYHLITGLRGAGFSDYWEIMAVSCIILIVGTIGTYFVYSKYSPNPLINISNRKKYIPPTVLLSSLLVNPIPIYFLTNLTIDERLDFQAYYNDPLITKRHQGDAQRNFVFIYAEGLERTFFDENIFPGLIKELRTLESMGTTFTNIYPAWGTNWTIGGMVSSQCGIPLVTPSHHNSMNGMDKFLPGAVCLGDLLTDDGYHLTYLGGADLDFAGKGKFYSTHGFEDVRGSKALRFKLPDTTYLNAWGLHDDSLLDIAYSEYEKLSEMNKPFGLFTLTLDTHPPRGNLSDDCSGLAYLDGSNSMLNAVACSDYLIGNFVKRILASKYSENTIILIASDHLSHKGTAHKHLEGKKRTNMFMIIDPQVTEANKITAIGTMMDVGPTLLHALGYQGSIGLGRDLLAGVIALKYSFDNLDETLKGWENSLMEFWEFPKIESGIVVDPVYRKVKINSREFKIPSLIEFDENMKTRIKFQPYRPKKHKPLIEHVGDLDSNTPFIWIDSCKVINLDRNDAGVCVVAGKMGARDLISFRASSSKEITQDNLMQIILSRTSDEYFKANRLKLLH